MNSSISFLSVLHNEKISSMYLFHSRGLVLLRFSISVSTADVKMLAKATAIFVPMEKRYKKSVSTTLWVYVSLLGCYVPFILSVAIRLSAGVSATNLAVHWFTVVLIYAKSVLNPVLYCWIQDSSSERFGERNYKTSMVAIITTRVHILFATPNFTRS